MPIMASLGALTYARKKPGQWYPARGQFIYGGYFAGVYGGQYLIVADKTTEIGNQYDPAHLYCTNLVSNGYSDWIMPTTGMYPVMHVGSPGITGTWPASQSYNVSLSPLRNYWREYGYPTYPPQQLVGCYIFATGSNGLNYNTQVFSIRAIRQQAFA